MAAPDYGAVVARQRQYFLAGDTRSTSWRKANLEAPKALFTENHDELCDEIWKDLRLNITEADLMDVAYNVKEAEYALEHGRVDETSARPHAPGVRARPCSRPSRSAGSDADHRCVEGTVHAVGRGVGRRQYRGAQALGTGGCLLGGRRALGAKILRSARVCDRRRRRPRNHGIAGPAVGFDLLRRAVPRSGRSCMPRPI